MAVDGVYAHECELVVCSAHNGPQMNGLFCAPRRIDDRYHRAQERICSSLFGVLLLLLLLLWLFVVAALPLIVCMQRA